jgi:hypothetical protein
MERQYRTILAMLCQFFDGATSRRVHSLAPSYGHAVTRASARGQLIQQVGTVPEVERGCGSTEARGCNAQHATLGDSNSKAMTLPQVLASPTLRRNRSDAKGLMATADA